MRSPLPGLKRNAICVIVDSLTKSIHFIQIYDTWGIEEVSTTISQGNSVLAEYAKGHNT